MIAKGLNLALTKLINNSTARALARNFRRMLATSRTFDQDHNSFSTECLSSEVCCWSEKFSVSQERVLEFKAVFPELLDHFSKGDNNLSETSSYTADMLRHVFSGDNRYLAMCQIAGYEMLEAPERLTPHKLKLVLYMAWVVEFVFQSFVVLDDVLDQSDLRDGRPCWYKTKSVGLNAINDGILLEQFCYSILRKHFSECGWYLPAMELLHDTFLKTWMGQITDGLSAKNQDHRLAAFNFNRWNLTAEHKTAPIVQVPVRLAMYMVNIDDAGVHRQVASVFRKFGRYFQMRDDYLDAFYGTDIEEGKCTWMAVKALEIASPKQRKVMEKCYGSKDPGDKMAVMELYQEMNLTDVYEKCKKELMDNIEQEIGKVSYNDRLQKLLLKICEVEL